MNLHSGRKLFNVHSALRPEALFIMLLLCISSITDIVRPVILNEGPESGDFATPEDSKKDYTYHSLPHTHKNPADSEYYIDPIENETGLFKTPINSSTIVSWDKEDVRFLEEFAIGIDWANQTANLIRNGTMENESRSIPKGDSRDWNFSDVHYRPSGVSVSRIDKSGTFGTGSSEGPDYCLNLSAVGGLSEEYYDVFRENETNNSHNIFAPKTEYFYDDTFTRWERWRINGSVSEDVYNITLDDIEALIFENPDKGKYIKSILSESFSTGGYKEYRGEINRTFTYNATGDVNDAFLRFQYKYSVDNASDSGIGFAVRLVVPNGTVITLYNLTDSGNSSSEFHTVQIPTDKLTPIFNQSGTGNYTLKFDFRHYVCNTTGPRTNYVLLDNVMMYINYTGRIFNPGDSLVLRYSDKLGFNPLNSGVLRIPLYLGDPNFISNTFAWNLSVAVNNYTCAVQDLTVFDHNTWNAIIAGVDRSIINGTDLRIELNFTYCGTKPLILNNSDVWHVILDDIELSANIRIDHEDLFGLLKVVINDEYHSEFSERIVSSRCESVEQYTGTNLPGYSISLSGGGIWMNVDRPVYTIVYNDTSLETHNFTENYFDPEFSLTIHGYVGKRLVTWRELLLRELSEICNLISEYRDYLADLLLNEIHDWDNLLYINTTFSQSIVSDPYNVLLSLYSIDPGIVRPFAEYFLFQQIFFADISSELGDLLAEINDHSLYVDNEFKEAAVREVLNQTLESIRFNTDDLFNSALTALGSYSPQTLPESWNFTSKLLSLESARSLLSDIADGDGAVYSIGNHSYIFPGFIANTQISRSMRNNWRSHIYNERYLPLEWLGLSQASYGKILSTLNGSYSDNLYFYSSNNGIRPGMPFYFASDYLEFVQIPGSDINTLTSEFPVSFMENDSYFNRTLLNSSGTYSWNISMRAIPEYGFYTLLLLDILFSFIISEHSLDALISHSFFIPLYGQGSRNESSEPCIGLPDLLDMMINFNRSADDFYMSRFTTPLAVEEISIMENDGNGNNENGDNTSTPYDTAVLIQDPVGKYDSFISVYLPSEAFDSYGYRTLNGSEAYDGAYCTPQGSNDYNISIGVGLFLPLFNGKDNPIMIPMFNFIYEDPVLFTPAEIPQGCNSPVQFNFSIPDPFILYPILNSNFSIYGLTPPFILQIEIYRGNIPVSASYRKVIAALTNAFDISPYIIYINNTDGTDGDKESDIPAVFISVPRTQDVFGSNLTLSLFKFTLAPYFPNNFECNFDWFKGGEVRMEPILMGELGGKRPIYLMGAGITPGNGKDPGDSFDDNVRLVFRNGTDYVPIETINGGNAQRICGNLLEMGILIDDVYEYLGKDPSVRLDSSLLLSFNVSDGNNGFTTTELYVSLIMRIYRPITDEMPAGAGAPLVFISFFIGLIAILEIYRVRKRFFSKRKFRMFSYKEFMKKRKSDQLD